jgi:hypothetical protein
MRLKEAIDAATQVLNEERTRPTIQYVEHDLSAHRYSARPLNIPTQRKMHPRSAVETHDIYKFKGVKLELLMNIYGQLREEDREQMIEYLLHRIDASARIALDNRFGYPHPTFMAKVSELPLIAEFCIRSGHVEAFFGATANVTRPTVPLAIMMMQLEEMVAFNWNLFSNEQLGKIMTWLAPMREVADRQTHESRGSGGRMIKNPHYKRGSEREANEIVRCIDSINEACRQARYWYLKGTLQRNTNVEIESDKAQVENFLAKLGFDNSLMHSLNEAEKNFAPSANPFELKNCLGHLRSFFEHMHREAATQITANRGKTAPQDFNSAMQLLRTQGYTTDQQDKFARGLFTLLSDEGVHPLVAERLFARLLRNMVIEYGFMFLTVMDNKGIKLQTKPIA